MKIKVDRSACLGTGMCSLTAPELFDQDDEDGRVVVRTDRPEQVHVDAVREAVALCPSRALSLSTQLAHQGAAGR